MYVDTANQNCYKYTQKNDTCKITVHIWIAKNYGVPQYILRYDTVKITFMQKLLEWIGKITVCCSTFYGVTQ